MRNLLAHETAGAARTRHSLRPLSSREGQRIRKTSGNHVARTGTHVSSSLRANGSRERAPDDRLREAIHLSACRAMDCFVASASRKDRERAARIPPHRHCEPTGRAYARPMTGSAKQSSFAAAKKGQICFRLRSKALRRTPARRSLRSKRRRVIASAPRTSSGYHRFFSVGFSVLVQKDMDKDLFFGDEGPKAFCRAPPYLYFG
jgi:hypothetical protein